MPIVMAMELLKGTATLTMAIPIMLMDMQTTVTATDSRVEA